jgi:hypothetical protein
VQKILFCDQREREGIRRDHEIDKRGKRHKIARSRNAELSNLSFPRMLFCGKRNLFLKEGGGMSYKSGAGKDS